MVDRSGSPVPFATIAVLTPTDSTLVTGTTASEEGRFTIPLDAGIYRVRISMLSFQDATIDRVEVNQQEVDLGTITLATGSQQLEQVEVKAKRNQMELKLDKRVFNVGQDLANSGANASDILDNLPSVTVDVEGNVNLRGSGNVVILINGKPSSLVQSGDPQSLRQLLGSQIERIEVITNPSARYEAEGEVGIINIVLKKQEKAGLNGSFDVNTGWPQDHGAAFTLNYRKNKVNFFINNGISYDKTPGGGSGIQRFETADTSFAFRTQQDNLRGDWGNNLRLGADIYFNEKEVLTLSGAYEYSEGFRDNTFTFQDLDADDEVMQTVTRLQDEEELEHEVELDARYEKTFSEEDHKLTVDVRYSLQDDTELADYREFSDQPQTEEILQRSSNTEDEQRFQVQSDYVHPFGNEGKIETGVRASLRTIDNTFLVEEQDNTGTFQPIDEFNNDFQFIENIYAGYAQIGEKFGALSLQAGLRGEYSDIRTRLIRTNEENPRQYFNLFPSAFIGYELDEANTLQVSYSRRISRPSFWNLIPFLNYGNSRNIRTGNPNLNPEYTDAFELSFMRYFERGSLLSSVYYRYTTGVIQRISYVDSLGVTRRLPLNLAEEHNMGFEFNFNYDITDWWSVNSNLNLFRAITNGDFEGRDLSRDTYTWTARASTEFNVTPSIDLQCTGRYRAPQETTQGSIQSLAVMDFGASLDVLNNKGTLTFAIRDVFNSRWYIRTIDEPGFTAYREFQWRPRQFTLSFNYRLNQKQSKGKGRQGWR